MPAPAFPDPECRECGQPFKRRNPDAVFCSAAHRKAFNNRRMLRGAALYDSVMASKPIEELLARWRRLDAGRVAA